MKPALQVAAGALVPIAALWAVFGFNSTLPEGWHGLDGFSHLPTYWWTFPLLLTEGVVLFGAFGIGVAIAAYAPEK